MDQPVLSLFGHSAERWGPFRHIQLTDWVRETRLDLPRLAQRRMPAVVGIFVERHASTTESRLASFPNPRPNARTRDGTELDSQQILPSLGAVEWHGELAISGNDYGDFTATACGGMAETITLT